jgi:hypothetical protein
LKAVEMPRSAKKPTDQAQRFIEAARSAGCSEDEAEIRDNKKRIARAKTDKMPSTVVGTLQHWIEGNHVVDKKAESQDGRARKRPHK